MRTSVSWTALPFEDGRLFVYSPRFGRTYLVAPDLTTGAILPSLLGLRRAAYRDQLADPAASVTYVDRSDCSDVVGRFLPRLYLFFHRHRTVVSLNRAIRLATLLAQLTSRRSRGETEIGRLVMDIERSVGVSDCYPRALTTAYLCMCARLNCQVTVGILAPSANLHAWCSAEGAIPYEPEPQHWYFSPLVVFDVTH